MSAIIAEDTFAKMVRELEDLFREYHIPRRVERGNGSLADLLIRGPLLTLSIAVLAGDGKGKKLQKRKQHVIAEGDLNQLTLRCALLFERYGIGSMFEGGGCLQALRWSIIGMLKERGVGRPLLDPKKWTACLARWARRKKGENAHTIAAR